MSADQSTRRVAVYAATKWGMNGWSDSLRLELQPDIRVIVLSLQTTLCRAGEIRNAPPARGRNRSADRNRSSGRGHEFERGEG
jgi:short-subunit dehydrogenase